MKSIRVIWFCVILVSCANSRQKNMLSEHSEQVAFSKGICRVEGKPYTGCLYTLYPNGDTAKVSNYYNGRLNGEARGWYPDGGVKFIRHYKDDVFEGNVSEWFPNGKLYRSFNYKDGQEDGMQTMYWDNGGLRANYQSKNGRKYGLTGIKNCSAPWDDSLKQLLIDAGM